MALAVGDGADHDRDAPLGMHRDLGAFSRHAGRGIDIIRYADPSHLAALARFLAPRRKARPVAEFHGAIHVLVVVAAVVHHAEGVGIRQLG